MQNYQVCAEFTAQWIGEVKARSEEEAIDKAFSKIHNGHLCLDEGGGELTVHLESPTGKWATALVPDPEPQAKPTTFAAAPRKEVAQ